MPKRTIRSKMNYLLIVILTLLNGLFAMSEMALAASRKIKLATMAQAGDKGAQAALRLMEHPTQFLSSVQVGITSIGMLNGIVGEAAFSAALSANLQAIGMGQASSKVAATAIVITLITFITIVFGELVPKRIGQLYPENVARIMAIPMTWVARIAKPFVYLLTKSTQAVLKLLRIDTSNQQTVTEEEINASLEEGVGAGLIEAHEHQMVQNVFGLDDRLLGSLMVPRQDIDWLPAQQSSAQVLDELILVQGAHSHSWYPVCKDSLDDVVGIINLSQLLQNRSNTDTTLSELCQAATFVPETLSGMELLEQFRKNSVKMAFVVDEYGSVQGLVTPYDLLEAITGELKPDTQSEAWAVQRSDGSWLLDGAMPITEFKSRLQIKELPQEEKGRYHTLSGLWMLQAGHIPTTGASTDCANWRLEVVDMDGRKIDKILAYKVPNTRSQNTVITP